MTCGIYQIVNKLNGKRYVGSSVNVEVRWQTHRRELRKGTHHAQHLQRSWNKHGEESFNLEVILECDPEMLIQEEQKELDSGFDYNSSPTAGSPLGFKFSDESRERVRQNRLDRYAADPEGFSAMMSSISKGKPKPESWKEKMSERLSGVEKTDSHKENMAISRAELTKEQVLEIRRLRSEGMDLKSISNATNCSWSQCRSICAGAKYQWAYDYSGPVDVSMFEKPQCRQYNNAIHQFEHDIHGERSCSQFQLKKEFPELLSSKVSQLARGVRNVHKGWRLKKKAPEGA